MAWILTENGHVASDHVIKIEEHGGGSLTLRLTDGSEVTVSKQDAAAALQQLAPAGLPRRSGKPSLS